MSEGPSERDWDAPQVLSDHLAPWLRSLRRRCIGTTMGLGPTPDTVEKVGGTYPTQWRRAPGAVERLMALGDL